MAPRFVTRLSPIVLPAAPDKLQRLVDEAWSLFQAGQAGSAERKLRKALQQAPDSPLIALRLSYLLYSQRRFAEAVQVCKRLLRIDPEQADAWFNLALCHEALQDFVEAARCYRRCVALAPDNLRAHLALGDALLERDEAEQAEAVAQAALAAAPQVAEVQLLLARALLAQGRHAAAGDAAAAVLASEPDLKEARHLLASVRLAQGEWQEAWPDYVQRFGMAGELHDERMLTAATLASGELTGKTIALVTGSVGFGDVIQACRYLPLLAAQGARLVLQVPAALVPLVKGLPGVVQVVNKPEDIPPNDYYAHLFLGLPQVFGSTPQNLPRELPYLAAEPSAQARWAQRLGTATRPRIGLAWSATHDRRSQRSIPAELLGALLELDVDLYVLQKDVRASDRAACKRFAASGRWHDHSAYFSDFGETAALISQLDLVISCDTVTAHLAGALAKPVWLMLPAASDWRWLLAREDSPWYPTARLFRQHSRGEWGVLMQQVRSALQTWLVQRAPD